VPSLEQWLAYQTQVHPQAIDLGLDRLLLVLDRLGWRQPKVPVITIAGTNGKGSVSGYCAAILAAAGYRAGTFTSPHLRDYRERIRIHDRLVGATELVSAFERIETARGEVGLTFFEFNTLAALLVFGFAVLRVKTLNRYAVQSAPDVLPEYAETKTPADPNSKPFFSVVTNRTYSTSDHARFWVNYRGLDALDFRVYRVKDPVKFFRDLDNPHQMGEDEEGKAGQQIKHNPTFLEKLLAFKKKFYGAVQTYVRGQLQNQSRRGFNQRFRPASEEEQEVRTPLNVSDYARVPLLNPDQMVSSWREKLPPFIANTPKRSIAKRHYF